MVEKRRKVCPVLCNTILLVFLYLSCLTWMEPSTHLTTILSSTGKKGDAAEAVPMEEGSNDANKE